ncbi:hypothetical protein DFQ28_009144 [Apophysomyces sp. BC1034]|nr:hypothetical protein DFQ28_009144 [Apophysomyces sp. BC1034]
MKPTPMKNQWFARVAGDAAAFDFANEDHVITFVVAAAVVAFEPGKRTVQDRHAAVAGFVRDAREPVALERGKAAAQFQLRRGEHIDDVVRVRLEHGHRIGPFRQAPQHQRRSQRYRIERAGGDADQLSRFGARRDDRDAGREFTQREPERGSVEVGAGGELHRWIQASRRRRARKGSEALNESKLRL